jgi:hypothetical protein
MRFLCSIFFLTENDVGSKLSFGVAITLSMLNNVKGACSEKRLLAMRKMKDPYCISYGEYVELIDKRNGCH